MQVNLQITGLALTISDDGPIDPALLGGPLAGLLGATRPPAEPAALPAPAQLPEPVAVRKPRGGRRPKADRASQREAAPPAGPSGRSASREERLKKIEKYLTNIGHAGSAAIARACNVPVGSITSLLKDPRFVRDDDGDYRVD